MPIPRSPVGVVPRPLLGDIAFRRILTAIQDGTLRPGERLTDDGLVAWLGVSRTPVREAVAKLAAIGVVEVGENRHTHVAVPDVATWAECIRVLHGLHGMSARWATPLLRDADVVTLRGLTDRSRALLAVRDPGFADADVEVMRFFAHHSGNRLLTAQMESLYPRVVFYGFSVRDAFDWDDVQRDYGDWLDSLDAAAARRDPMAAAAAVLALARTVDPVVERVAPQQDGRT